MIRDARDLPDGTELRADVCVVGSGPAGLTVALELEGSGLDVLVLEAGGFEHDEESQALYEVDMTGEQFGAEGSPVPVSATRLRQLGGTSGHWAGYSRPLRPIDLEARPEVASPGWPISYDELARHYDRALELLEIGPYEFDYPYWDREADIGPLLVDDGILETVVYQLSPTQFGGRYRGEVEASRAIDLVLHAAVTEILTAESGRTIERLDVATTTGRTHTAIADRYVIACGGIENARMLLASARDRGGIGNSNDLVGRGFCEHGQNTLGIAIFAPTVHDLRAYARTTVDSPIGRGPDGQITVQAALVLSDETLRREELLGVEVQMYALPTSEPGPTTVSGPSLTDANDLLRSFGATEPGSMVGFSILAEQAPHPDSRVTLTSELDALGIPVAALHWTVSEDDRRSIVRGLQIMGARLGAAGIGRLQVTPGSLRPSGEGGFLGRFAVDPASADPDGFHLTHANHHCCTVPMAADSSNGVCDADLKVWGFEDLHLAGSGVFPSAGVAAPTVTITALSVRLAEHLRAVLA